MAHARKEMVKLALTGEGKVSSSTKRGVDGAKRKAVRGGEERIEISNEHKLKLTRLGWIRSYSQRTKTPKSYLTINRFWSTEADKLTIPRFPKIRLDCLVPQRHSKASGLGEKILFPFKINSK